MKKFLLLLMAAVIGTSVFAEETATAAERPKTQHSERRHKRPPRRSFQKGHGMWTAFAHLSAEERQDMLKLQREDPEKFRTEMNKLAEKFFNAEKERRQELAKLIMEYKNATDDKVKAEIHEKIKVRIKENFHRRLRQSRMHIAELKKQTEQLEKELDLREKAEDKIVEATVKNILEGKRPNFPPPGPRPPFRMKRPPAPLKAE